jgi:hypothetical protein
MIILCTEDEKTIIEHTCKGDCEGCVLKDIKNCPVGSSGAILTTKQIQKSTFQNI